ncbi:MAG: nitroreductase family protein [Armatimonadota bacterium]|nr:nitroreductase family protein [Armatimonadota bacterium]
MEFFVTVKKRKSVRKFEPREVEDDKINIILETINLAPSAGNLQAYEVVLVKETERRKELARAAYGQNFLAEAPLTLIFCANPMQSASKYGKRGAELYSIQDATIAAAYCQLAATALGLASVWVGAFDPKAVSEIIKAPASILPIAMIPIGYAAEEPERTPRRSLEDLVHKETL